MNFEEHYDEPTLAEKVAKVLNSTRAQQIMMVLILAGIATIALLVVKPTLDYRKETQAKTEQAIAETASKQQELNVLQQQLRENKKNNPARELATALPKRVRNEVILRTLTRLSERTGVQFREFEAAEPSASTGSGFRRMPINVPITCRVENCLRFLGGLQGMARMKGERLDARGPIWFVDQITAAPADDSKLSMTLTSGMYLGEEDTPATPPAGSPTTTTPTPPPTG